jgi:membrane protease YdiL (CAAX protease family)
MASIPQTVPESPGGPAEPDADQAPWRVWMAPAAVALGLAGGVLGGIVVDVIGHAAGSSLAHPTPAVSLTADLVFDLAFVGAAIYFASLQGRPSPARFGFRRVSLRTAVMAVVVAAVGYYTLTAVYASLFALHGSDKLPSELGVTHSTAALVGAAVFVCVIAPMAEEFFFRGFFFGALRQWRIVVFRREIGTWVAAVLTGILFGLAHTGSASPQYLVPLAFLGFVLCLVRWRTRSLYPCMALHSFNNSLALGVNQLHWNVAEILALMAGSWLVIGAITGPLTGRSEAATA